MLAVRHLRTRKPAESLSSEYRIRRNRMLERARNEYLKMSLVDESSRVPSVNSIVEGDVFSAPDDVVGLPIDDDSAQHANDDSSNENAQNTCCVGDHDDDPGRRDSDSMSCSTTASFQRNESLPDFEDRLAAVFTEQNMTHRQIKAVLLALKSHSCFSEIHIDPRTILKTPVHSLSPISSLAGGEYLHLGTEVAIKKILQSAPTFMIPDVLKLDFSTDEASLDKASSILMWPIQIRIANIPASSPEMVGIFRASKKPTSVTEFFHSFVTDMRSLLQNGVQFGDKNRCIELRCFTADALARAFVLCHRSHNSRFPCSRCCVQGESVRSGVMVYRGTKHPLRTEDDYRSRIDRDHHNMVEQTPLADLPFDIVSNTVFDYMHLVCLGIMEKILQGIIDGRFVKSVKLSANHIKLVTDRLEQVSKFCPRDFARKPVNIDKHGKFKATEHRQILLYSGVSVFNGLVNSAVYKHFLLLHVAIRILTDPNHTPQAIDFAQECIETFVDLASDVYGVEFVSYNTHTLLHLPDDVRSFGHLDSFSAFPYENNMTFCRKLCRKPNQHLQQISNRIHESCRTASKPYVDPNHLKFVKNHVNGPTPSSVIDNNNDDNCRQYKKVITGDIHLSISQQDSTVMLKNGSIGVVKNIIDYEKKGCHLLVRVFSKVEDLFKLPCDSSLVDVFVCSLPIPELTLVPLNQVIAKCFRMPYWSPEIPTIDSNSQFFVVVKIMSTSL
ncbi:uncharacterized protein LOC116416102 isoform X2 [Nasonia vitripennis]|nr:uncharacterized protein LOC116416102 isoform X2 [Nasonia vitripennis]